MSPTRTPSPGALRSAGLSALSKHVVDPASVRMLGHGFCRKKHVVVLGEVDPEGHEPITVGMLDPDDRELTRRLQGFLRRTIVPVRLSAEQIVAALDIGYERERSKADPAAPSGQTDLETLPPRARTAQRLLDELLQPAVAAMATEVHLERHAEQVSVRARVAGALHPLPALSHDDADAVIERVEALGRPATEDSETEPHDPARRRRLRWLPLAGDAPRPTQVWASFLPGPDGADAIVELKAYEVPPPNLGSLGLPPELRLIVDDLLRSPEGLLLVCGPAGSGRTTTLHAMLGALADPHRKLMLAEDSIEVSLPGIVQRPVTPEQSMADLARAFARHGADVVGLGDLPGESTALAAADLADTGRMVVAAMHATDPVNAIVRLRSMGLSSPRLAEILLGVCSQRLVPRGCEHCRVAAPDDAIAEAHFARVGRRFAHLRGQGCPACDGTGYRGRVAIFEVLRLDPRLADRIADDRPGFELRHAAREAGQRSLYDAAIGYVEAGEISFETLARHIPQRLALDPRTTA